MIYISTFRNKAGVPAGYIVTKTIFNRLFWTEREQIKYKGDDIQISRDKNLSKEEARWVAQEVYYYWVSMGRPSNRAIVDNIRKHNSIGY